MRIRPRDVAGDACSQLRVLLEMTFEFTFVTEVGVWVGFGARIFGVATEWEIVFVEFWIICFRGRKRWCL